MTKKAFRSAPVVYDEFTSTASFFSKAAKVAGIGLVGAGVYVAGKYLLENVAKGNLAFTVAALVIMYYAAAREPMPEQRSRHRAFRN